MLERLEIDNYQCIAHSGVPLGRFTTIVGPSGKGKSTFVRALTSLCFNQTGDGFIRHKQQKARVALTFDGGQEIIWEKARGKGAVYSFGDQEYTRTGNKAPPDIEQALGVRRIEVDKGVSWRPQFHLQFDAPLLLTESSTMAARALAQLTKLSVLVEAQVECRRDKLRAAGQKTSAEEEVGRLKEQLDALPNVRRTRNVMERAEKLLRAVTTTLATAKEADEIAQDIAGSLLLADITPPTDGEMEALIERMATLERVLAAITASETADDALATAKEEVMGAEACLSDVEGTYQALIEELGACPLCGSVETWGKCQDEGAG
jgi:DNA repair ATPase RecN